MSINQKSMPRMIREINAEENRKRLEEEKEWEFMDFSIGMQLGITAGVGDRREFLKQVRRVYPNY